MAENAALKGPWTKYETPLVDAATPSPTPTPGAKAAGPWAKYAQPANAPAIAPVAEPEGGSFLPEVGKGIAAGAINTTGTMVKGLAAEQANSPAEREAVTGLAADFENIPTMTDAQWVDWQRRAGKGIRGLKEMDFLAVASQVRHGTLTPQGGVEALRGLGDNADIMPEETIQETSLFKTGQKIQDFASDKFAAAKDYEDTWTRNIAEGLGSTVPFMAAGAVPGVGPVAGVVGGSLATGGQQIDDAISKGATQEQIIEAARLGRYPGLTEQIPIETLFERVPLPFAGKLAGAISKVLAQAAAEGGQEAVQQAAQNLIARYVYKPDQDIMDGVAESAAIGGIVGGGLKVGEQAVSKTGRAIFGKGEDTASPSVDAEQEAAPTAHPAQRYAAQPSPMPDAVERDASAAPAAPEAEQDGIPITEPASSPATHVPPEVRATLRKMLWTDADIDIMSPEEAAAEVSQAIDPATPQEIEAASQYGVAPQQAPVAPEAAPVAPEAQAVPEPTQIQQPEPPAEDELSAADLLPDDFASRSRPATIETAQDLEAAGQRVNVEPSEAQAQAGNYKKAHVRIAGQDVTIENPKGSTRRNKNPDGPAWESVLPAHYGYIKRTTGADGDQLDVYVGDNPKSKKVYIIDQRAPTANGRFDEHKVILGADSIAQARDLYTKAFSDGSGASRIGAITSVSPKAFRDWLNTPKAHRTPYAMGKIKTTPEGWPADAQGKVKRPQSMVEFLAANGGVRDHKGELANMDADKVFVPGAGRLVRANGRSMDDARALLVENGYLQDAPDGELSTSTIDDMLVAMADDIGSRERFSRNDDDWAMAWHEQKARDVDERQDKNARDRARAELQELGIDPDANGMAEVIDLMTGGMTVDDALERDAMGYDADNPQPDAEATPIVPFFDEVGSDEIHPGAAFADGQTARAGSQEGDQSARQGGREDVGAQAQDGGARGAQDAGQAPDRGSVGQGAEGGARDTFGAEVGADGKPQTVIPGAERISEREQAQRGADAPLKPKAPQKDVGGLFGDDAAQSDLMDLPGAKPERKTNRQKLLDDRAGTSVEAAIEKFSSNKIFTADKVAAARARLRSKMSQLNSGLDPEMLIDGMTIAGAYIESGVRNFAEFAQYMREDFGAKIHPYLLSFWEGARNYPGLDTSGMTSIEETARIHSDFEPIDTEKKALAKELDTDEGLYTDADFAADEQAVADLDASPTVDKLPVVGDPIDWRENTKPELSLFPAPQGKTRDADKEAGQKISQAQADAKIAEWKAHARRMGDVMGEENRKKVIISAFDYTGTWSQPWRDAGFTVIQYDVQHAKDQKGYQPGDERYQDLITHFPIADIEELKAKGYEVYGVLAATPCTTFAASGARWWEGLHNVNSREAVEKVFGPWAPEGFDSPVELNKALVYATEHLVEVSNPSHFHVLENPMGRLQSETNFPDPQIRFNPNVYGDPYTKRTALWGDFNADMPTAYVEASDGSKIQAKLGSGAKVERSKTPTGFAYAFFMANAPKMAQAEKARPAAAAPAKAVSPDQPKKSGRWIEIGINARGNRVWEDDNGVRSYTEGNVRVTESVSFIPGQGVSVDKANRSKDYLVADKPSLADLAAQSKERKEARDAQTRELTKDGGSVRFTKSDGRKAIAGPDMSEPGKFRVTRMDDKGPIGHTVYNSLPEAVEDALREGYQAEKASKPASNEVEKVNAPQKAGSLVEELRDHLLSPDTSFATINQARKWLLDHGWKASREEIANKEAEELIEHAVVLAARDIIKAGKKRGSEVVYDRLVSLYERQPRLATRTSQSLAEQAYSTPMPLAYVVDRLANVAGGKIVYEPTAGNGALLIDADPETQQVHANELNKDRSAALRSQGFRVTDSDAMKMETPHGTDRIVANPPFGAVRTNGESIVFEVGQHRTTAIDQAIVLKALEGMVPEGRAVFIVGSVKDGTDAERSDNYNTSQKRKFYKRLYDNYNVVDHFTVSGQMYQRQGAAWPVDVLVIDGKGKSHLPLPAAKLPAYINSWASLKGYLDGGRSAGSAADRGEPVSVQGREEVSPPVGAIEEHPAGNRGGVRQDAGRGPAVAETRPERQSIPSVIPDDRIERSPVGVVDADQGRGILGSGGDAAGTHKRVDAKPRDARVNADANATGQVPYRPYSREGKSLNTLVPAALGSAMDASLAKIEQAHGDIDAYVAQSLGYQTSELKDVFSAEQIDAIALAIDNVAKGDAFIIGDQTGIGKGRVVAAAIRFAHRRGMMPVFVTEKPDLYGDMYRDLNDIKWSKALGREPTIFMTNSNTTVPLDDEAVEWIIERDDAKVEGRKAPPKRGQFTKAQSPKDADAQMLAILSGKVKPDVVFTTYDQMNTIKGQETSRRRFMTQLAPRAFLIMDESHNAGGQGVSQRAAKDAPVPRSQKFRQWLTAAKAVMYSSATYAKNPTVMDLYSRTDMAKAVDDPKDLPELIAKGKVPLQQVVASMLAESGQYARRERSFEGVEYGLDIAEVDQDAYASFAHAIRSIFDFDRTISEFRKEWIEDWLKENGEGLGMDSGIGELAANSTEFASIMHNIVNQMLLAIKAKAAVERAKTALENGEKPVITLSFTNESFVTDYAADKGIAIGEKIDIDFKDVVRRYLDRTLRITIKKDDEKTKPRHIFIPVSDLPGPFRAMHEAAQGAIETADLSALPVSPIDYIRHELTSAGYKVAEITGRGTMIDYKTGTLAARPSSEMEAKGKRVTIKKFNDGRVDVVILNRSGSTGVSLHASSEYKDRKRRRMVIAQADGNIDTHMQTLGRIHRTGQVIAPAYTQLSADIPAEARPTAVLMKKMASLSANTTASRKSAFTADAVDFMNEYGDLAAVEWAKDNPDINAMLGNPVTFNEKGQISTENPMQRLTGRIMLMTPAEQQDLLDVLTETYAAILAKKEAMGENALEAKVLDLQAEPLSSVEIKPAIGSSPFEGAAKMERMSVKSVGLAMKPRDVIERVADALGQRPDTLQFPQAMRQLERIGAVRSDRTINRVRPEHEQWSKWTVEGLKNAEAKEKARKKGQDQWNAWSAIIRMAAIGRQVVLSGESEMPAIVIAIRESKKAKSPSALSSWSVELALPDSARTLTIPFSQILLEKPKDGEESTGTFIRPAGWSDKLENLEKMFEKAATEGRSERFIATGNLLAAFDGLNGKGQIIQFTDKAGNVQPGILMPRIFDVNDWQRERRIRFQNADQVMRFITESEVKSITNDKDQIEVNNDYKGFRFTVQRKAKKIVTDEAVRKVYDLWQERFGQMEATVDAATAKKLFAAFQTAGVRWVAPAEADLAQSIVHPKDKRQMSVNRQPLEAPQAPQATQADINRAIDIVSRVADIRPQLGKTIPIPDNHPALKAWGENDGAPRSAAGFYDPVNDIIALAMDSFTDRTAYHEAFHRLQSLFLTKDERFLLQREAARLRALVGSDPFRNPAKMSQKELEAEAFGIYSVRMDQGRDVSGLHIGLRRAWERIRAAIRRARNLLAGHGYRTAEDIFKKAHSGEMKSRSVNPIRDSDRDYQVSPMATASEAFKRWFGDSKVVDEAGKPLVMYHGTRAGDFEAFDPSKTGEGTDFGWFGNGAYFTSSPDEATNYATIDEKVSTSRRPQGSVYPVYLKVENPYITDQSGLSEQEVKELREEGHDGIFRKEYLRDELPREIVVFEPSQIKSATGNRGTFDPADDRISFQLAPGQSDKAEFVPPKIEPKKAPGALVSQRIAKALRATTSTLKGMSGKDRSHKDDGESVGDYLTRKWIDYLHPLRMMQERGGYKLSELNDAYLNARLMEDRALPAIERMHDIYVAPAVEALAEGGASLEDLHKYLYALHAEERNRVVGMRHQKTSQFYRAIFDHSLVGASGMSVDQVREVMAEARKDPEKHKALRIAAGAIRDMIDANLTEQRKAGLISAETHELLTTQWKNYVPLKGMDGMSDDGFWRNNGAGGFDVRGDEFKMALGRFSEAENVIAHAITQNEQSILRQHKNAVGKAMARFINEFDPEGEHIAQVYWGGNDNFLGDITKAPEVYKRVIGKNGLVDYRRVPNPFSNLDDVLAAKVGGRTFYIRFRDPKIGLALRKMGMAELGTLSKIVRPLTVWQSIVNTRANPAFTPINIIRDIQTGTTHLLDEGFSVKQIATITKNIPQAMGALWRMSRKKAGDGVWDKMAAEYVEAGGKITFHGYATLEENLHKLQKQMIEAANGVSPWKAVYRAVTKFVGDLNDAGENGIRLASYAAARNIQGRTAKEAAFMARDLTVDFKKHGEIGPAMNAWFVFFNAAAQGAYNVGSRAVRSKAVRAAIATFIFGGMMQHIWNTLFSGDDDDGESYYHKMLINEPWKLERQYVFFIPGTEKYVSFPMAYGYNAFHHLGLQGAAIASGAQDPVTGILSAIRVAFDAFNPIGSGSMASMVTPTIGDPAVDIISNENFAGAPIYPEGNPFDRSPAPDSSQAFSTTHPAFMKLAELINWTTGGDAVVPGAVDVHPDTLEHLWGYFVGGLGRFVTGAEQTVENAVVGEFEPGKTPWVRNFYGEIDETSQRTEYYKEREAVLASEGYLKAYNERGETKKAADYQKDHAVELQSVGAFKAAEKQRKAINKERRRLEADASIPAAQKDKRLKELEKAELDAMRQARTAYVKASRQ